LLSVFRGEKKMASVNQQAPKKGKGEVFVPNVENQVIDLSGGAILTRG
jgi:hypothetical protein